MKTEVAFIIWETLQLRPLLEDLYSWLLLQTNLLFPLVSEQVALVDGAKPSCPEEILVQVAPLSELTPTGCVPETVVTIIFAP